MMARWKKAYADTLDQEDGDCEMKRDAKRWTANRKRTLVLEINREKRW